MNLKPFHFIYLCIGKLSDFLKNKERLLGSVELRNANIETSLAVQWLGLCLSMQGVRIRSQVREVGSLMLCSQETIA